MSKKSMTKRDLLMLYTFVINKEYCRGYTAALKVFADPKMDIGKMTMAIATSSLSKTRELLLKMKALEGKYIKHEWAVIEDYQKSIVKILAPTQKEKQKDNGSTKQGKAKK